jgi:cAMP-dependent protein kinase regulator
LQDALKNNFIFMDLSAPERTLFVDAMQKEEVVVNTKIIQQGDTGDYFYIVESGTVLYVDGETEVGQCQRGGSFGELALLYDSPRAISCVAGTNIVVLFKVDQSTFQHLLARHTHAHEQNMKDLVRKIRIFEGLDDAAITRFTNAMTLVHWDEGARIVQKGEEGTVFYIIESGQVKIHDIGLGDSQFGDQIIGPGSWFGERALLTGEPRAANVTALTEVSTLAMDRETFELTIGPLQNYLERTMKKHFLEAIPVRRTSKCRDQFLSAFPFSPSRDCPFHRFSHRVPLQIRRWINLSISCWKSAIPRARSSWKRESHTQ